MVLPRKTKRFSFTISTMATSYPPPPANHRQHIGEYVDFNEVDIRKVGLLLVTMKFVRFMGIVVF